MGIYGDSVRLACVVSRTGYSKIALVLARYSIVLVGYIPGQSVSRSMGMPTVINHLFGQDL